MTKSEQQKMFEIGSAILSCSILCLISLGDLARTYRSQGRWNEGEKLEVQVMDMRKKLLGAEHPHTLTSMASLASTYWNQGRWNDAEKLGV